MIRISYDFHIHSCLSPCGDNESTPANIVGMAALIGLDAIAICDHNSCLNVPAAISAGKEYGVTILPGMELTTSEEVHVLCYFPKLENALSFNEYVDKNSLFIENNPDYFGEQLIYNENDENCGIVERLLPAASEISFDEVFDLMKEYDGLMVPAHINKSSTSMLSNLGFIPPESKFTAAEIQTVDQISMLREEYPYLNSCHILTSSDAHYLKDIHEPIHFLHVEENTPEAIISALYTKL